MRPGCFPISPGRINACQLQRGLANVDLRIREGPNRVESFPGIEHWAVPAWIRETLFRRLFRQVDFLALGYELLAFRFQAGHSFRLRT